MPNYQNGKIYTIRCKNDDTLIYVGSTCETLSRRLTTHRASYKANNSRFFYTFIDSWEDWYIELYEECPCNTKEELRKREGEVIRSIGTLNYEIAGRTKKEYEDDNKLIRQSQKKIYYINNKDKIREYRENNIDKIKAKDKKYAENNKEKIKTYQKEYRLKMKENKISANNKDADNSRSKK